MCLPGSFFLNTVFGQYFPDMTEAYVWHYDKLLYLGLRRMNVKQWAFSVSELFWYAGLLIGVSDRTADIYEYSDKETITSSGDVVFGAEFGIRWHTFQTSLVYYDETIFWTIGYRIGFQIGL